MALELCSFGRAIADAQGDKLAVLVVNAIKQMRFLPMEQMKLSQLAMQNQKHLKQKHMQT